MRYPIVLVLAAFVFGGSAHAQVINGESTDDAAYAPRPPARWHSPESRGETPGGFGEDERSDRRGDERRER